MTNTFLAHFFTQLWFGEGSGVFTTLIYIYLCAGAGNYITFDNWELNFSLKLIYYN
jgi:hypothetical protein